LCRWIGETWNEPKAEWEPVPDGAPLSFGIIDKMEHGKYLKIFAEQVSNKGKKKRNQWKGCKYTTKGEQAKWDGPKFVVK